MGFLVREINESDLDKLMALAKQFTLLNLPDDKTVLREKIERSMKSFAGQLKKEDTEYIFALEDTENGNLVGTSLILGKHGSPDSPHHYFKIEKRDRFSEDLGVGFIHQVLSFHSDTDGPTEIGGLLVDYHYRRRPEKLGRIISLIRFVYMAMFPEKFEKRILCELTPPLGEDGRSDFWEALGRRFTGLPYQEADQLSQNHKEFITSLFPPEDIYVCLLESKARLVIGRVGEKTKPAQHLLEKIGFEYINEIDPFDGGPHYACDLDKVSVVANGSWSKYKKSSSAQFQEHGLVGAMVDGEFRAASTPLSIENEHVSVPQNTENLLKIDDSQDIFYSVLN